MMKRALLHLVLGLVFADVVEAQSGTIMGSVFDAQTGKSLPGANVILTEIVRGAAAEFDGAFTISGIPAGSYTLRVSYVGYRTHEQPVEVEPDTLVLDIELQPDFARHDDIVVTGLATERTRATSDVAVGRIDAEPLLQANSFRDFSQLVTGRVSGLTVQPSSGNVGTGVRYVLRTLTGINGDGQPIVFVDGVRVDHGDWEGWGAGGQAVSMLNQLNPQDIASIDVLKGPAGAALYGTSASNGVVLIKTKSGALGSPASLSYRGTFGANSQAYEYDAFNSVLPDLANSYFRDGQIGEHMFDLRGGGETIRYFTSYAKRREDGHMRKSSQDRNSFRANVEVLPNERTNVRANAAYVLNEVSRPYNDGTPNGYLFQGLRAPFVLGIDSLGIENQTNIQNISRFTGSIDARYRPLAPVELRAVVGYDGSESRNDWYAPPGYRLLAGDDGFKGVRTQTVRQYTYYLTGRYSFRIAKSIAGQTNIGLQAFERERYTSVFATRGFLTDLVVNAGAGENIQNYPNDNSENSRELGIFVSQELQFDDKVFATLGLRRDYASAFGFEAPTIFYPRASLALRLDRMVSLPLNMDFMKLRSAFGQAGQPPGPLDGLPLLWSAAQSGYGAGAVPVQVGNAEIEPERISEFEIGTEFGFFGDRLAFDGTYYRQWADNSIVAFANPPSSGLSISDSPENVGSARGWGIETMLSLTPVHTRENSLDLGIVWQWQENEVTDLGGAPPIFSLSNVIKEGLPNGAYYAWASQATFNSDGSYAGHEFTTTDEDGDGEPDRAYFGTAYPSHSGSVFFNLRVFKNLHFSGLFDWQEGLYLQYGDSFRRAQDGTHAARNIALVQIDSVSDPCAVYLCDASGALRPEFETLDVRPLPIGSEQYRAAAEVVASTSPSLDSRDLRGNFIEDASFVRLRELSVRYDFSEIIRRTSFGRFLTRLDVTLAGRNLFLSSRFSGIDPEANNQGATSANRSTAWTLPLPRTIYLMLNLGF
jgi:TonB-dependent SusC/RagA subfamily outer membrane receptor